MTIIRCALELYVRYACEPRAPCAAPRRITAHARSSPSRTRVQRLRPLRGWAALLFFDRQGTRRRVPLPALALGWTMDMVAGQPLAIGVPPPFGSLYHMVSRGYDTERGRRHLSHREARPRDHRRRSFRSDRVTTTYPRHSHSHIMRTYLNVLGAFLHGRTERPPKEASLPLL